MPSLPWSRRSPKQSSEASLRDLYAPLARKERGRLVIMSIASIVGGLVEAAMLILLARIAIALAAKDTEITVDNSLIGHFQVSVWALIVAAGCLAVLRMTLQWVSVVASAKASMDVMLQTRRTLTDLFLATSWPLQSSQREGRLQELVSGYAAAASGAIGALTTLISNAFNLAALLGAALLVTPISSLGAATAALLVGLMLRPLRAAVRRRNARKAEANLALSTGVTELASTLQEVRIFGVERQVSDRLTALAREASAKELKASYIGGAVPTLYQGAAMLLIVAALALAYGIGVSGLASLGAVMLILLRSLSYAQGVQGGIQSLHAAAPYLETLEQEEARYRADALPRDGDAVDRIEVVEFENVSYEYEPGQPVLRNVSFRVPRGEVVGIVGPSGSGKSTLVQLLLRLRTPTEGRILVDGRDLLSLSVDDWYDRVTFVSQETRLFAGTIGDNIRFFRSVDQADVERAAKLAYIHDDIMSWPLGYDTPVGERGSQLSGGQRQRLCIARALVDDPDLVVLDEPTSALDVKSESLMRDTMLDLAPRRTVVVVAHRLSTLSICDRIMVILGGELQGFDKPDVLEATNPFYREALRLSGMR